LLVHPECPPPSIAAREDVGKRDEEIYQRFKQGVQRSEIAKAFGLSAERTGQIVAAMAEGRRTRPARPPGQGRAPKLLADLPEPEPAREVSNYRASLERRAKLLRDIGDDKKKQAVERKLCQRDPVRFINNWGWTYDPRLVPEGKLAYVPFDLYPRQVELIRFFEQRLRSAEEGLVEKSREVGFTWVAAAFACHAWIFIPGFATLFGSYEEKKVDDLGNLDSIFQKIRLFRDRLPSWLLPEGFFRPDHDNFMRIVNPATGNTIVGEVGDNIGRGGRSTLTFIDEAAWLARAESVQASTSATSNCRIWASSVNGMGNLFAKKRHSGLRPDQVFRFHYLDNPLMTPERIERKKQENAATPWVFAAEYEIDYTASVEGVCIPGKWVEAAVKLYRHLKETSPALLNPNEPSVGGMDIGGGKAQSVVIRRRGHVVDVPDVWGDPDTTETAHRALDIARDKGISLLNFDEVAIGKGVLSILTLNATPGVTTRGINTGSHPSLTMWEDQKNSRQKFLNLKAEIWWLMRERFRLAWEYMNWLEGDEENAVEHPITDLIAVPPEAAELIVQLSLLRFFRNERGKTQMESKVQLATRGVASPDQADALALTFVPGDPPVPFIVPFISEGPRPDPWAPGSSW
jgi:hypothetical protein